MLNKFENIIESEIKSLQPLSLAMIGDAVETLLVRSEIILKFKCKVNLTNKLVSKVVSAGAQFRTFKKIENSLTESEQDVARRARNTSIHSKAKNFSYTEYIYATALEAVIGYLYLTNQNDRINEIIKIALEEIDDKNEVKNEN